MPKFGKYSKLGPNLVKIAKSVQNIQQLDEIGQNMTGTDRQTNKETDKQ